MCVAERLTASFAPFGCGSASARSSLACTIQTRIKLASLRAPVLRNARVQAHVQAHAERRIWRRSAERARPCGTSGGRCARRPRENMALHTAAPTPPPGADSPMHSTRAQDASEPCIADFRRSPSGLHEPKDDGLLAGENAHLVTFLIITQLRY